MVPGLESLDFSISEFLQDFFTKVRVWFFFFFFFPSIAAKVQNYCAGLNIRGKVMIKLSIDYI